MKIAKSKHKILNLTCIHRLTDKISISKNDISSSEKNCTQKVSKIDEIKEESKSKNKFDKFPFVNFGINYQTKIFINLNSILCLLNYDIILESSRYSLSSLDLRFT